MNTRGGLLNNNPDPKLDEIHVPMTSYETPLQDDPSPDVKPQDNKENGNCNLTIACIVTLIILVIIMIIYLIYRIFKIEYWKNKVKKGTAAALSSVSSMLQSNKYTQLDDA